MSTHAKAPEPDAPRLLLGALSEDLSGQVLGGRYFLSRKLGAGGMATIYEAEHVELHKRLAVKVLDRKQSDPETVKRFLLEARAASRLRHEHIIDVTDFGHDAGRVFMVMEYLDGEDLAATLERTGPLPWPRVLAISKQVCQALIAAHARGVVHCDIKPANCFRTSRAGNDDFIKVLDFGVASFACERTGQCLPPAAPGGETRRRSGPVLGTPGYMPDEQLAGGPYDHRVDIFALGVMMYRLLTNKMPYAGGSLYGPRRPSSGPFPLRRASPHLDVPAGLEAVILKSVAADPAERYQSAAELFAALERAELAIARAARSGRLLLFPGGRDAARSSSSLSQTAVGLASDSRTELSQSQLPREQRELTGEAAPRRWEPRVVHPSVWMLAGMAMSLATTAAARLLIY